MVGGMGPLDWLRAMSRGAAEWQGSPGAAGRGDEFGEYATEGQGAAWAEARRAVKRLGSAAARDGNARVVAECHRFLRAIR